MDKNGAKGLFVLEFYCFSYYNYHLFAFDGNMKNQDALFWLFLLIALVLLIWKLFGSPGYEAVLAALVGAIGLLWKEFSDFKGEMREFTGQVKAKLNIK